MCEASCYRRIPEGAAWAKEIETGELGSIVSIRDGFVVCHAVDMYARLLDGCTLHDSVDATEVRYWCPADVSAWYDREGKRITVESNGVMRGAA